MVFEQVYEKRNEGCIGDCDIICRKEKPALERHGPLSFFNIGNNFEGDKYKILFVGKNTWYDKEDVDKLKKFPEYLESAFQDCRADGREMFEHNHRMLWNCIRKITQQLYPKSQNESGSWKFDELWASIAITNLTKCNTSTGSGDTTPYSLTRRCIPFFSKEVSILMPKHLILFTGKGYDDYIMDLPLNEGFRVENITDNEYRKPIGNKNAKILWWDRKFSKDGNEIHFLRTRHPQFAPIEFADEIVKWIRNH